MTEKNDVIEPQAAPLSHLKSSKPSGFNGFHIGARTLALAAVVCVALSAIVYFSLEQNGKVQPKMDSTTPSISSGVDVATTSTPATPSSSPSRRAPFAQSQHQLAREKAQTALAVFVEKQILLEDSMQVALWGKNDLEAALALAKVGDEEFVQEKFSTAIQAYQDASSKLQQVIDHGHEIFAAHLATAHTHILAIDHELAVKSLQQALAIRPNHAGAKNAMQRALLIPEVVRMLRTAKNHELSNRYQAALETYNKIALLDPLTSGLTELRAKAVIAQAGKTVNVLLGQGFSDLEAKKYDDARSSFKRILSIDAGNDVALGGLQQVAKARDLSIIRTFENSANQHMESERWQSAIDAYASVLKLDNNIQFAKIGLAVAKAHLRANQLLQKIVDAPQKLSSERLYLDAQAILIEANKLEFSGPRVGTLIENVSVLLETYRDPVDLVLLSDNATDIIISNVGALGSFERKILSLRPGAYTIRGSQNGCRDILLNVEVLPGIEPLDVSCLERVQ